MQVYYVITGCSKCKKQFPRITRDGRKCKANFSGFERETWIPRDGVEHKTLAARVNRARTEKERKEYEKFGGRWSDLFRLEYFDPIMGHTVDPMHCLFLGIAKTMTKYYMKSGLLSRQNIYAFQMVMNQIRVPTSISRIPHKISSGFASLTSDQLKNWTLIFSALALKDWLPNDDYQIWKKFVRATSLVARKVVLKTDVETADSLFLSFCRSVHTKYGEDFITPNFHMVCHLADVMHLYGPVYSFWCYSFERWAKQLFYIYFCIWPWL